MQEGSVGSSAEPLVVVHRAEDDPIPQTQAALAQAGEATSPITVLLDNLSGAFDLVDVDATGHCQYDALAHQIRAFARDYAHLPGAAEYTYQQVRHDIARWLQDNRDFRLDNGEPLHMFVTAGDAADWEHYCVGVADTARAEDSAPQWGDHITLTAAAQLYRRPIRVWASAPGGRIWDEVVPIEPAPPPAEPFNLAHLDVHYMSVVRAVGGE